MYTPFDHNFAMFHLLIDKYRRHHGNHGNTTTSSSQHQLHTKSCSSSVNSVTSVLPPAHISLSPSHQLLTTGAPGGGNQFNIGRTRTERRSSITTGVGLYHPLLLLPPICDISLLSYCCCHLCITWCNILTVITTTATTYVYLMITFLNHH